MAIETEATPALIGSSGDSLREAFGKALCELADEFPKVVVLDADIAGGTGVHHFRDAYPERFYQCGIAEQNMMAMAAGLASVGLEPVVTTFAVFCLRALEQARLSIAYSGYPVKIVASHPGLDVGPDGGSAQCLEDLAAFRAIPEMTVVSPADPVETRLATRAVLAHRGPVYMRTGRSPATRVFDEGHRFELGKGTLVRPGKDLTFVACGVQVARAVEAARLLEREGTDARVVNLPTLAPIDHELLEACARETRGFVVTEDHGPHGGLGGAVAEALASSHPAPIEFVAVLGFGTSGEPDELANHYGLDAPALAAAARRLLERAG